MVNMLWKLQLKLWEKCPSTFAYVTNGNSHTMFSNMHIKVINTRFLQLKINKREITKKLHNQGKMDQYIIKLRFTTWGTKWRFARHSFTKPWNTKENKRKRIYEKFPFFLLPKPLRRCSDEVLLMLLYSTWCPTTSDPLLIHQKWRSAAVPAQIWKKP